MPTFVSGTRIAVLLALLLAAFALAGCNQSVSEWHGKDISNLMPPLEFELINTEGEAVNASDSEGQVRLVFFGFTHCPDICPTTLARLSQAVGKLPENERERITIMFVSVDPNRDTPEQIAAYTRFYGDRIAGVTGSESQLRQLVKRYRTTFGYDEPDENNNYNVSHSAGVYVFDTRGKARLLLRPDLTVAQIRDDISALAQEHRS
ncbi:protein SCO1/2 [Marinobacter sp. LV10R520-4]|uniref:SCO family protein n=1 Tax=Marinobacter sp. LV10R520-4 TaxID=1761796 RepID=UPI000BF32BF2|nr:SCO family protein [Marinobacter sp. LV10R520-4]PFG53162.1 protein SCO1/2 [Marinobacter sp. LV10R520-4]